MLVISVFGSESGPIVSLWFTSQFDFKGRMAQLAGQQTQPIQIT